MTAGRGITHREMPVGDAPVLGMQVWVNLPAADKQREPAYEQREARPERIAGGERRVFAGGAWPVTLVDVRLEAGAALEQPLDAAARVFVYVVAGEAEVGETRVTAGQIACSAPCEAGSLALRAVSALHAIVLAGRPIGEPITFP
jgi:redox-sensitive bicupin YhaK (pirin superfamily)